MLPIHQATRYVVPLREGGSLPAVLDTDGGGLFVTKFRGAGQGARALIAELLVGEVARVLGLPVPALALIEVDECFGRSEVDPEIQDILRASHGINVGLRYLEGCFNFDSASDLDRIDPELAATVVWLDALTLNVDRTARNPNMLVWRDGVWLIDHGAAFYIHHDWAAVTAETSRRPFPLISQHVLLELGDAGEGDERCTAALDAAALRSILQLIPDALLLDAPAGTKPAFDSGDAARAAYVEFLLARLEAPRVFVDVARQARIDALARAPERKGYRR